jgi:tRNA (guanine-N7-)-methyltransferase
MPVETDHTGSEHERPRRSVRSFVVRAGRMTDAQQRAWRELWPQIGIETTDTQLDLDRIFGRRAPRTLEIGFGNGETLATLAAAHPERDCLGIEVHRPGIGHLMLRAKELGLANVRIVCRDAVEVLDRCLAEASLDEVLLYFPDPWPKKRHHKRRIVQSAFVALVASRLKPGGLLHMATDWLPYAEHMLAVAGACPALVNESPTGDYVPRPESRPQTRFERRGRRLGHDVRDLAFRRS